LRVIQKYFLTEWYFDDGDVSQEETERFPWLQFVLSLKKI